MACHQRSFLPQVRVAQNPRDVPDALNNRLDQAYDRFLQTAPHNSYATTMKQDGIYRPIRLRSWTQSHRETLIASENGSPSTCVKSNSRFAH